MIEANFWRKFIKITESFLRLSYNIVHFAQIFPNQASKRYYFLQQSEEHKYSQIISFLVNSFKLSRPKSADLAFLKWQP